MQRHWLFISCITLISLVMVRSAAAVAPTVDTVTAAQTSLGSQTNFNLTEDAATTVYVHGTITDTDGCADVATNGTVTAKFYRTNVVNGNTCVADNNQCYVIGNIACTKSGCDGAGDNTFNYQCTRPIQYYADSTTSGPHVATDWTAYVTATDAALTTGTNADTIEMNTLVALTVPATMSYGTIALDGLSAEQALVVTNTGNSGLDIQFQVNGAMTCTGQGSATIPAANARYSVVTGFSWNTATALSTTLTEFEFNMSPRINDALPRIKDMYFLLKVPLTGIRGSCSNTLSSIALADAENGW